MVFSSDFCCFFGDFLCLALLFGTFWGFFFIFLGLLKQIQVLFLMTNGCFAVFDMFQIFKVFFLQFS